MAARVGIIYPGDGVLDRELWSFAPETVSLHITRTPFPEGPITLELVEGEVDADGLAYAGETLRPIGPDVVTFACTSVSFVAGAADFTLAVVFATGSQLMNGAQNLWFLNTGLVDGSGFFGTTADWGLVINSVGQLGAGLGSPARSVLPNRGRSGRGMPRSPSLEASTWVM